MNLHNNYAQEGGKVKLDELERKKRRMNMEAKFGGVE